MSSRGPALGQGAGQSEGREDLNHANPVERRDRLEGRDVFSPALETHWEKKSLKKLKEIFIKEKNSADPASRNKLFPCF